MNVDAIFAALNRQGVDWLLLGGVNFLLRHRPQLTFDTDIWIRDDAANLERTNLALRELGAEWGSTADAWRPVPTESSWLTRQGVICLTTPHGALDVFRSVRGLEGAWDACRARAVAAVTAAGTPYLGLSDADMLACQLALDPVEQKPDRIAVLREALGDRDPSS